MFSTLKSLRALSDPTRLRIVALLEKDELSVNELQEITRMGQSRISTHLGLLQDSELVQSRREGKRTFYKLNPQAEGVANEVIQLAIRGAKELPEHASDQINLKRILNRRREQAQVFFNQIAGRFDRVYGPGRSRPAFRHFAARYVPAADCRRAWGGRRLVERTARAPLQKSHCCGQLGKDRSV